MSRFLVLVTVAGFGLTLGIHAQTQTGQGTTPPPQGQTMASADKSKMAGSPDEEFILKAAEGGAKEVEFGKLGSTKATNPQVKAYAARLVKDHTAANNQLMSLAKTSRVTIKPIDPAEAKKDADALGAKTGADFDKEFIDRAIKDHELDITAFAEEALNGKDPQVKAWAEKTLPTLREHLKMARDLQGK